MSNEMPKSKILNQVQDLVRHDHNVILNSVQNPVLNFDIHLTSACLPCTITVQGLREVPPYGTKAGILAFGIAFVEIAVRPFSQLVKTIF